MKQTKNQEYSFKAFWMFAEFLPGKSHGKN